TTSKKLINKIIGGKKYVWIDYQSLIDYLPALKINSKDVIARRIAKYEKLGLIKKHLHKTMAYGVYTFFHLEGKFNTMFEIQKVEKDDNELEKIKEKMGLLGQQNEEATQKSSGFDSKVETTATQKSLHNTPNKILPPKESSSTDTNPAASDDDFFKELKTVLSEASIKNHNSNTLKNIKNYSDGDINEVKKVIEFIKLKSKNMNSKVLVAILKDKDHQIVEPVDIKKVTRTEKIDFMIEKLGEFKIRSMRNSILKFMGCECENVDSELGNQLCKKYNKLNTLGGTE
ncbi:MAG: hypothetical protein WBG30_07785, partial [Psychrilyobacter sp.]|uniref:hypothetical protein n=1 Tax=Psychrilyobacter sp. TaxID=2586924 RepID=UPI003C74CE7D